MYFAVIDCGTTNSRVFVVNETGNIFGRATKKVGVRDTAISGNKEVLKGGLKETLDEAISSAKLTLKDLQFIISSGMITSEIGLLEIPHLWAPVHIDTLANHLVKVHDLTIFPVDIPVYFIPGIKNRYDPQSITLEEVGFLDFMRGEEVQVAGLLSTYDVKLPVTILVLSSHTKFIPVDQENKILGSLTTLSGQVFEAIVKETSIGKSIRREDNFDDEDYLDFKIIDMAYQWVRRSGFLRTLLMPRFLDTLVETKWYERKLFVEGAIASEDIRVTRLFASLHFSLDTHFILLGIKKRCLIYEYLLKEKIGIKKDIWVLTETQDVDRLSIQGSIHLAKKAGLI